MRQCVSQGMVKRQTSFTFASRSMPTHPDTLLRQWHMLRLLPRQPFKISVPEIRGRLALAGFAVTVRTVQRDLVELSSVFPLVVDDRAKPFGWSWLREAPSFDLPGLALPEALTLGLVEQHLRYYLPSETLDYLQPFFRAAKLTLSGSDAAKKTANWLDKVRAVPPAQPLLPAHVDAVVQRTVYEALLEERQLHVQYMRKGEREAVEYRVHPLAVVQRGPVLYLICTLKDYQDLRLLTVHRIQSAQLLDEPVIRPAAFSVDAAIHAGLLGFHIGRPIEVELYFQPEAGEHLYETPLADHQRLEPMPDGRLRLTASVPDTRELRWWLLGLGAGVEVNKPAELRDYILQSVRGMRALYEVNLPDVEKPSS